MTEQVAWGTIQGRPITFPMEVERYHAATMGFSVPADAAAALLPGEAFVVTEIAPGTAQLIVSLCDYRENPWGDYNEVNLGFLARPADVELTLGTGPIAEELRSLRLPKAPDFCTWGEDGCATFQLGQEV